MSTHWAPGRVGPPEAGLARPSELGPGAGASGAARASDQQLGLPSCGSVTACLGPPPAPAPPPYFHFQKYSPHIPIPEAVTLNFDSWQPEAQAKCQGPQEVRARVGSTGGPRPWGWALPGCTRTASPSCGQTEARRAGTCWLGDTQVPVPRLEEPSLQGRVMAPGLPAWLSVGAMPGAESLESRHVGGGSAGGRAGEQ